MKSNYAQRLNDHLVRNKDLLLMKIISSLTSHWQCFYFSTSQKRKGKRENSVFETEEPPNEIRWNKKYIHPNVFYTISTDTVRKSKNMSDLFMTFFTSSELTCRLPISIYSRVKGGLWKWILSQMLSQRSASLFVLM